MEDEAEPPAQKPNVRPARARERRDYRDLANRGTTGGDQLSNPGGGRGVSYFTRSVRLGYSGKNVAYHITVSEALRRIPKSAINSIAFRSLTLKQKKAIIIRSSLFLKEKYLPTGEFEKLKARLVALGNMQDLSLYSSEDTGSPTVSILSLLALVAKGNSEERVFKKLDVVGAYMKASIGDKEVLMLIDPSLTSILAKVAPEVKPFLNEKVSLLLS